MGRRDSSADPRQLTFALRTRGLRATSARLTMLTCLAELGHATPEQLAAVVGSRLPGLSISTVYRTLEVLGEHDLVRHAHLTGSVASYYLASGAEHAHLVCSGCGTVDDLAGPALDHLVEAVATSSAFAVNASHLTLQGLCENCQKLVKDRARPRARYS
jgi:Fur family ferric uptake transcriptional regulator